jgi:hypothetical protein
VALIFLAVSSATAQDRPARVTLTPPELPRWDVAGLVAWLNVNKSGVGLDWNDWYDAGSSGAVVGYHWTPHLKSEVEVATSSEGNVYSEQIVALPGQPFPIYRSQEHFFRTTTLSAGGTYQFLENSWGHPFIGAGVTFIRERERIETPPGYGLSRDPRFPVTLPALAPQTRVRYFAQPFLTGGVKAYVSERAFIRAEMRSSLSSDRLAGLAWRVGAGVDF